MQIAYKLDVGCYRVNWPMQLWTVVILDSSTRLDNESECCFQRGKSKQAKSAQKGQIQQQGVEDEYKKAPHSFIFNRGHVGKNVSELIMDMRRVMEPYTAEQLQVEEPHSLSQMHLYLYIHIFTHVPLLVVASILLWHQQSISYHCKRWVFLYSSLINMISWTPLHGLTQEYEPIKPWRLG